jgi:hypothetical protein
MITNPVPALFRAAWTPAGFPGSSGCAATEGAIMRLAAITAMQKDRMPSPDFLYASLHRLSHKGLKLTFRR